MKTLKITSRKRILAFIMFFSFLSSFAQQESKVWLTIDNESDVPSVNQFGDLVSANSSLNNAISSLNIKAWLKHCLHRVIQCCKKFMK